MVKKKKGVRASRGESSRKASVSQIAKNVYSLEGNNQEQWISSGVINMKSSQSKSTNYPFCWWWQTNNSSRSNTYLSSRLSRMWTDREAQGKAEGPWERQGRPGEQRRHYSGQGASTETGEHTGSNQISHKTRDFEKCATMPKSYLLSTMSSSTIRSVDHYMKRMAWRSWTMRQSNCCYTPAPVSRAEPGVIGGGVDEAGMSTVAPDRHAVLCGWMDQG